MRKIVVSEYMTLDGVIEDPGGAEKTRYGGWSFQFWSEEAGKFKFEELFASDALLLGRVPYQGFAAQASSSSPTNPQKSKAKNNELFASFSWLV